MKAIRIHQAGGPEVMQLEELATPTPGPDEVLIQVAIAGVNYADILMPRGMAQGPHPITLPITPGFEVTGTVTAYGNNVTGLVKGTRVVAVLDYGGYAEYAIARRHSVVVIPNGVDFTQASALLVQGITAYGLLHDALHIQSGESVLIQAAAGGVGTLAIQLAKLAGAHPIIGTASSAEKRSLVLSLNADYALDYTSPDWIQQVYASTDGKGVDTVLESVGGEIGTQAFATLAPLGRLVIFGGSSGQPAPLPDAMKLNIKGLTISGYGGPWLRPGRAEVARQAIAQYLQTGQLHVVPGPSFPLADAAAAHRALMGRHTTGKVTLTI